MCLRRELFVGAALIFCKGAEMQTYLFVFAKQSPYLAYFSPMYEVEPPAVKPLQVDSVSWEALAQGAWNYNFTVDYHTLLRHDELPCQGVSDVRVLPFLAMPEERSAVSDAVVMSFQKFLGEAPETKAPNPQPKSKRQQTSTGMDPDLLKEHPWLAQVLTPSTTATPTAAGSSGDTAGAKESGSEDGDPCDDIAIEAVFSELHKKREAWVDNYSTSGLDFKYTLRGGAWTQKHKKVAADAFQGRASSADAQLWCLKYGLAKTSRYAISVFGESKASALSRMWCHKMQYYYDIFVRANNPDYKYSQSDHSGYEQPVGFAEVGVGLTAEGKARVAALTGLKPSSSA